MNGRNPGSESPLLADGDLLAAERRRRRGDPELLTQGRHEVIASPDRCDTGQFGERQGTTDPVCHETHVVLELGDRGVSVVTEDPVDASRIEPKPTQPPLHVGDVVSLQHRATPVKEPVAQPKAGFNKARPRLVVTDAVSAQPTLGLEHLHCCCRPGTVRPEPVVSMLEPELVEPLLQVNDGLTGVTLMKWQEIFAWRYRPRTAHKPELCGTSIISDIVGDAGQRPVVRRITR